MKLCCVALAFALMALSGPTTAGAQSQCALAEGAQACAGLSDCHWCNSTKNAYCAPKSEPCPSDVPNSLLCQLTNPGSPLGKQHCEELDNPGGTNSPYFKDRGWKYTSPPWTNCTCNRTKFNFVNRVTHNLDGYEGVTFWYLGIQTPGDEAE